MIVSYMVKENEQALMQPDEWLAKVKELGLDGQASLMDGGEKSPVPFMRMTKGHVRLFRALCPDRVLLTDFNVEPIPMEVLGLIGLAIKEQHFDELEVWYCAGAPNPDPVVVGVRGDQKKHEERAERYLVAQWGVEDASQDRLIVKAKAHLIAAGKRKLEEALADAQRSLADIDGEAEKFLLGGGNSWDFHEYGWQEG